MATQIIIKVPEVMQSFRTSSFNYSSPSVKQANIRALINIKNSLGTFIDKYSYLFQIPSSLIASFIATESTGRNLAPNKYLATGYMQITPAAFYETFSRRLKTGDIAPEQQAFVKSKLPSMQFSNRGISSSQSGMQELILKAFSNPEFNIYAGCLYMDFLYDRFAINGIGQTNKVLVGYNAGAYQKFISANIAIALDSNNLATSKLVPQESRGYIVKILGIDGYMDLIHRQNAVAFKD